LSGNAVSGIPEPTQSSRQSEHLAGKPPAFRKCLGHDLTQEHLARIFEEVQIMGLAPSARW
jgi:hypothetical protein